MSTALRYLLAVASGLALALPFTDRSPVPVWFALAPIFYLVAEAPRACGALGLAAGFSAAWVFPSLWFVSRTTPGGMAALCIYTTLCYVAALWGVRWLARRGVWGAVFGSAALWALVELARSRVPVFGFPWLLLGHATGGLEYLRQDADLLGVYGLSFLVAAINAALAFLVGPLLTARLAWRHCPQTVDLKEGHCLRTVAPGLIAVLGLLLAGLLYGRWRVAELAPRLEQGPELALIQGSVYRKVDRTDEEKDAQLEEHLKLHEEAVRAPLSADSGRERQPLSADSGTRPALVCWAETMVPGTFNRDPYAERFRKAVRQGGVPTLCGSDWVHPDDFELPLAGQRWYNAAFIVDGQGRELARYAKRRLVPFGEYTPFRSVLPFLELFGTVTRDAYTPGEAPSPVVHVAGVAFSLCICIEDCHPDLAREAARNGAEVLLNVTNDAWFAGTHAQATHLRAAAFRAVEVRRPLVRATNSGVSAQVDPLGAILVAVPPDTVGVGRFHLSLLSGGPPATLTLYLGEAGAGLVFALILGGCLWADGHGRGASRRE